MRGDLPDLTQRHNAKVIDAHVHFWSDRDIPVVVGEARRLRINRICASCLADWDWSTARDHDAGNDLVFRAAADNREVLGYVYVDPCEREKALSQIDAYLPHPAMIGIKLWIACAADDRRVHPIVERACEEKLVILVHAWRRGTRLAKGYQTLPSQVAELARSFPDVGFIMAHMGGDWENGVFEVADQRNVLVDTSGSINEAGMVEHAVSILGAQRVVYGSDAPGCGYLPNLGKILSARLDERDKIRILGGNMRDLLARGQRGERTEAGP